MKKWFCTILAVILLCSAMACAEEFTLRNGIKLGDTMEEVLSKETIEIKSIDDGSEEAAEEAPTEDAAEPAAEEPAESEQEAAEEESEDSEEETGVKYPYSITTEKATVAGVNDSCIEYKFDADKKLREVVYDFRSSSNKDTIDSDYDSVNSALIRKYGSPLGYSGGDCYIFLGNSLQSAATVTYLYKMMDYYGDLRDYDEWDVEADGYHVKIEQVEFYTGFSYSELNYSHTISYTYFTDEDLHAAQQEKHDNQAAIDSDI